jgi:hypothetical protein
MHKVQLRWRKQMFFGFLAGVATAYKLTVESHDGTLGSWIGTGMFPWACVAGALFLTLLAAQASPGFVRAFAPCAALGALLAASVSQNQVATTEADLLAPLLALASACVLGAANATGVHRTLARRGF